MSKSSESADKKAKATKAASRAKKAAGGKKVLGTTADGVRILRPSKATHFTAKELREAIASLRSKQ